MRQNYVIVLAGRKRTGKTTETLKLIEKMKKKTLIFDLNNEEKYRKFPLMPLNKLPYWKNGNYRVFTNDVEHLLHLIHDNVRNAVIVLEDSSSYLNNNTTELLRKIMVSVRHWNLDVMLTFHGLGMVPPLVYTLSDFVLIKKTNDTLRKLKRIDKIPNPDELINAWEKVQSDPDQYAQLTVSTHA